MCNLNVIVVLEFISRDLYLLFAILFSSKFQNIFFSQHMRPISGLKFPMPFVDLRSLMLHAKFQNHRPFGSEERRSFFFKFCYL